MSPRMKRVLYALAVGIVFALFTSITDAGTPQADRRGRVKQSSSRASTNSSLTIGASSIRVNRKTDLNQHSQELFLQQQFLLQQQAIQPQFIVVPTGHDGVPQPVSAKHFVPFQGSGQSVFDGLGFRGYGSVQQHQHFNRISFGK